MAAVGSTPISLYYTISAGGIPLAANLVSGELAINITDGKLFYKSPSNVVTLLASAATVSSDVVGPASATDNALVRFDTTTGKLIQNSVGILSDAGVLTGLTGVTSSGSVTFSALTSGRVTYATTGGLLTDNANLTFNGSQLTINGITAGRGAGSLTSNTAFGASALNSNTTGAQNTAVGDRALFSNITADSNTAVGQFSLYSSTGNNNTAIGKSAAYNLTTGINNTVIGYRALESGNTSYENVIIGALAGVNLEGSANVIVGYNAVSSAFSGTNNTCIGKSSGNALGGASYNTIIGQFSGNSNGLDISGTNGYVVLSDGLGNPRATYNASGVGFYSQGSITTKSATTTLTGAEVLTLILNTTVGGITITMPTGTNLDTATGGMPTDTAFLFTIINTAGSSSTVAVNTGITSVGSLTVAANSSARFTIRKTAANTFVMYRT
jgi:hypothetical protein